MIGSSDGRVAADMSVDSVARFLSVLRSVIRILHNSSVVCIGFFL